MLLHTQWYGSYLLEKTPEGWSVSEFFGSEKDPSVIADEMNAIADGEILDRETEIAKHHEITHVSEERLNKLVPDAEVVPLWEVETPYAHEQGYQMTLLLEANRLKDERSKKNETDDSDILSAVGALTDIDSSLNLVQERIREWYAKIWPEGADLVEEEVFLRALSEDPSPLSVHSYLGDPETGDPELIKGSEEAPPGELEQDGIKGLAELCLQLWRSRETMESYIEVEMERTAPCLSRIVGPLVGARLIHSAGGLKRLALLPASTVQVLGAEKMFFKFLKEGGRPPKHGVLFQHPWVHSLPASKRGKMARSLASAASLASRMDAYGGGDPEPFRERLEKRAHEIREMEVTKKRKKGGGQPPFREGWWANKGGRKKKRRRRPSKR